jgi:glycosyltransferase involved in cell wall biosynthesis
MKPALQIPNTRSSAATPHFSIIVPTYNRPAMLQRALQSILGQTGASFDCLVVDDGDGSGAAAASALGDPRMRTLDNGGRGQVAARHLGAQSAQGRWITFLDDDDWWADQTHLTALAEALGERDGLAFGSGRIIMEDDAGPTGEELAFIAQATPASLRHNNTLLVSSLAFPRRLYERLGPFDAGLPFYWDWDWYLRLVAAGVPLLPAATTAARISARPGSVSSATFDQQRTDNLEQLRAKHALPPIALKNHLSIAQDRARQTGAGV